MSNDITLAELEAELLPERQTLWGFSILSPVIVASNGAETVQAVTALSFANSYAHQTVVGVGILAF